MKQSIRKTLRRKCNDTLNFLFLWLVGSYNWETCFLLHARVFRSSFSSNKFNIFIFFILIFRQLHNFCLNSLPYHRPSLIIRPQYWGYVFVSLLRWKQSPNNRVSILLFHVFESQFYLLLKSLNKQSIL